MKLRPHQENAISMLREILKKNKSARVMVGAPCSFGKTILAAHICKAYQAVGKRVIFICDRIKLVNQTASAFYKFDIHYSVIQAHHPEYRASAPIQIASINSLENFRHWPDADIVIVDEAHMQRKSLVAKMGEWNGIPFIGLSATPYSKGLGKLYDELIVPITPRELTAHGYLCPVEYFGGRQASLEGVKTKQLSTGGTDYTEDSLATAIEKDKELAGDVVKNWIKHAAGRMTIAFSPSVAHSKHMVEIFNKNGIPAVHIDGYMKADEQQTMCDAHARGDFYILSCSRLLNTGYDEPRVSCLIDCYPTKSIIQYVQRAGRIMRIFEGKDNAIYLDHAGNVSRHGFAEDIVPEELDDGEKKYNEKSLTKKDEKAKTVKNCPVCYSLMTGPKCGTCGHEFVVKKEIITDGQELERLEGIEGRNWNRKTPKGEKEQFYGMLATYAANKGYKQGWAANVYRERSGVWPNKITKKHVEPDGAFMNYIKHRAIKNRARQ